MKKSRLPVHRHPNGHWCHCPFGNKEPYVSPRDREVYGHKEANIWVEAAKLDWLRGQRSDPHHQRFLDRLELAYPDHDHLYPWLVREHRKGRVVDPLEAAMNLRFPTTHDLYGDEDEGYFAHPMGFSTHEGYKSRLYPDYLDQITDWMKYQKQAGKGIDIMRHEIGPAVDAAQKADIGGEVVHEFPNGYKVVKLRNKRDMVCEGDRMHHCIGSPSMGYIDKNNDGEGLFYSLRDEDNHPYGTAEISKKQDEYFECPGCKQFAIGKFNYDSESGSHHRNCENCGHTLTVDGVPTEGVKEFPMSLKGKTHPDHKYTSIEQMFGPHDNKMDDDHEQMFNEYFGKHGHPYYESDGNPEDEEEEEEYQPWWDSYYYVPGATTAEEYMDHVNGEHYDYAPEEYQRAMADADEHDLEGPDLEVENPDIDSIFEDLQGDGDPETINNVFHAAKGEGHLDEFASRAQDWLNQEYEPYLDPYGEGSMLPSDQYPENNPDEKYFARNLLYQLEKHYPRDPQTGENQYQTLKHLYPVLYPQQKEPGRQLPEIPDPSVPIPEQTGPAFVQQTNPNALHRRRNVELPYGRGEQIDPNRNMDVVLRDTENGWGWLGQEPNAYPRYPQQDQPQPSKPFIPKGLDTPEGYFTPGQETTEQHQRPIPGMQWTDTGGPGEGEVSPNAPYNPNEPYMFPQGYQQGKLFPGGWYIDYDKQRAQQTDLPEHLFPPNRYGYHRPRDAGWSNAEDNYWPGGVGQGQVPLWEGQFNHEGQPATSINTQQEFRTFDQNQTPVAPWNRPRGLWQAKTWTDVEGRGGKPRPKLDTNEGLGIHGIPVHTGKPHLNGRIIEHTAPDPFTLPGFEWRRPAVYDKKEDRLYVGQPGMEHADMMKQFHKPNPWGKNFMAEGDFLPGLIDIDGSVEGGGLSFYKNGEIPNEEEFHDWVEGQHGVRSQDSKYKDPLEDLSWSPDDDTIDVRESTYHPAQNEEWVAEDEPVFSAVIPEGRWRI